ncbi:MAG: hemerythrin family protein [Leptospiraceae bacterium]|nr:hemerythrin family protein [Leptospiraceae bacterium]
MKKFDFPEQREHKSQHKHFIRVVEHRINERKSGDVKASSFLVNFLRKWLYNHILTEDRKYGQYITRRKKNSEIYFKDILEKTKIISISQKQVELYSAITGFTDLHEISSENALLEVLKIWKIYRLNVNIPIIDMQHLWLVKMIVELEQKKKIGSASDREQAFMHSIKTAINYSKEHFILEEMIFEKFMPNILKTHSFQHRQFLEFISLRNEQNKQGLYAAISNLVADFKEWIVSHIAIDDRILKYIAKKNSDELKEFLSTEISEGRVNVNPEHLRFYNRIRKML